MLTQQVAVAALQAAEGFLNLHAHEGTPPAVLENAVCGWGCGWEWKCACACAWDNVWPVEGMARAASKQAASGAGLPLSMQEGKHEQL